jgi:DNA-binding NarL/FixJ family response regulator
MFDEGLTSVESSQADFGLTEFEKQLIRLIATGRSKREMAKTLRVSESAVRLYVVDICDKLSVANELELILLALHYQLLAPQPKP